MLSDFKAYQMAKVLYQSCHRLRISYTLKDQLSRASASVALNIAEGSGKRTRADQSRYYSIALGSLRECHAILDLENRCQGDLEKIINELGAILYKLSHQKTKAENKALDPTIQTEDRTETETETETESETD